MNDDMRILFQALYKNVHKGYLTLWIKRNDESKVTHWIYIDDDITDSISQIESLVTKETENGSDIYFGVSLSKNQGRYNQRIGKTKRHYEKNIFPFVIPALFMDFDTKEDPKKANANVPENKAEAVKILNSLEYAPSALVNSGHGIHAYWFLSNPRIAENEESVKKADSTLKRFATYISFLTGFSPDINASEASRVLRIPGTKNYKSAASPLDVNIIEIHPENRYDLERLTATLNDLNVSEPDEKPTKGNTNIGNGMSVDEGIDFINNVQHNEEFKDYFKKDGSWTKYRDGDQNRCDLVLSIELLKIYNGDKQKADEAFRKSGLYRDKWERVDYRERTLDKAFNRFEEITIIPFDENLYRRLRGKETQTNKPEPVKLVSLAEIQTAPKKYIYRPFLRLGQFGMIQAIQGSGKTTFIMGIASRASRGLPLLENSDSILEGDNIPCESGAIDVIYLCSEEDEKNLQVMVEKSGGDLNRIHVLSPEHKYQPLYFKENCEEIRRLIRQYKAKLIIFDPIQSFLGGKIDMNKANQTREVIGQVARLAEEEDCTVLVISHQRKSSANPGEDPRNSALGSSDISAISRCTFQVMDDPTSNGKLATIIKCNEIATGYTLFFDIKTYYDGKDKYRYPIFTKKRELYKYSDILRDKRIQEKNDAIEAKARTGSGTSALLELISDIIKSGTMGFSNDQHHEIEKVNFSIQDLQYLCERVYDISFNRKEIHTAIDRAAAQAKEQGLTIEDRKNNKLKINKFMYDGKEYGGGEAKGVMVTIAPDFWNNELF